MKVSLYEAYPNPFNPSTTIKYDLNTETNVNLSIYDIRVRLVETLVNEYQNGDAGYSVVWNADMYSSGVYFVRLTTDSEVRNNKIMLIK